MNFFSNGSRSVLLSMILASVALTGCGGGGDDSSQAAAQPAAATQSTVAPENPFTGGSNGVPAPTPTPDPAAEAPTQEAFPTNGSAGNSAPTIGGVAATSIYTNSSYAFAPAASDADKDQLTFQIANKPTWATFSTVDGKLSGTPSTSNIGTYANIVISVSDGKSSVALPAFTLTVSELTATDGVALQWTLPTQTMDGAAVSNVSGYVIVYGKSATVMHNSVYVNNPGLDRYVFDDLATGTYYFGVKVLTADGATSGISNVISAKVL